MLPITVLMPVYNGEKYLNAAVKSILSQNYSDFEFLIINDGSTDNTPKILESFRDPRIKIIHIENRGVAAALRLGVELSQGEYIARMDADDESLPGRLEIQKRVLDRNPQVCLVHGRHDLMDKNGTVIIKNCGKEWPEGEGKWLLLWANIITHPTVMIRTRVLRQHCLNYRTETNGAEDFDLWNRLGPFGEFLPIPRVLIRYRLNPDSVNRGDSGKKQWEGYTMVIRDNFQRFGLDLSLETAEELAILSGQTFTNPLSYPYRFLPGKLFELFEGLSKHFVEKTSVSREDLNPVQAGQLVRWSRFLLQSSKKTALLLLLAAGGKHRKIAFSRLFLMTLSALFLPKTVLSRINKSRTRPLS